MAACYRPESTERGPGPMTDLVEHIVQRIASATVVEAPFPHAVIEGLLPAPLYERLLDGWPAGDAWLPISAYGGGDYEDRVAIDLGDASRLRHMPEEVAGRWQELREAVAADAVRSALLKLFVPVIKPRLRQLVPTGPIRTGTATLLLQDRELYAIGPHTDTPMKLVTGLLYFARANENRHAGTSLYAPKDASFSCEGGPHYPFEMFDRLATIPYVRNNLFVFACSNRSFHGVEPLRDLSEPRRLLDIDITVAG